MVNSDSPKKRCPRLTFVLVTLANVTGTTSCPNNATNQRTGRTNRSSKSPQCMDLGKLKPVIKDGNTSDKTSFVSKPAVVVSAKM